MAYMCFFLCVTNLHGLFGVCCLPEMELMVPTLQIVILTCLPQLPTNKGQIGSRTRYVPSSTGVLLNATPNPSPDSTLNLHIDRDRNPNRN